MAGRGRPRSPWTVLIWERLHRGPSEYHRLVSDASSLVPPGRGYRRAIDSRAATRIARGSEPLPEPTSRQDKDAAIRAGQRTVVVYALRSLRAQRRVIVYEEDGAKMVKLGEAGW